MSELQIAWGFDPGFTTGWASVNYENGDLLEEGSVKFDDMTDWLFEREPLLHNNTRRIVVEDFALRGGKEKAQIGSHFETVQVIGMLRLWSARAGLSIHLQPPSIKPIAQRFTGRVPKGAHSKSHPIDAYNHVCYYLKGIGHYATRLERELREAP